MSVFGVYTYTVKPEKLNGQMAFLPEFRAWMKK